MYDTTTAAEFRKELSSHINRVKMTGKRVLIVRNGKDAAALVSVRDMDALEQVDNHREEQVRLRHERMIEEFRALKKGLR